MTGCFRHFVTIFFFINLIKSTRTMSSWPNTSPPKWTSEYMNLLRSSNTSQNQKPHVGFNEIAKMSRDFPRKFPKVTMISQNLVGSVGKETIERNINSVYPIIHEYSLYLCASFLKFKRIHGSDIERRLYKDISVKDLIDRLLSKRAAAFIEPSDSYLLLNGEKGFGNWLSIGTLREKPPLTIEECLSYDEIKLSALLSVSSYSYFINDGNRHNNAVVNSNRSNIQDDGIIIGLIGTRLELENVMEYQELVVTRQQNVPPKYRKNNETPTIHNIFADFYEEPCFIYNENTLKNDERFVPINTIGYFDNIVYAKRLALSFDTLLLEANYRARNKNTTAYIHVVGLGLGVWKLSNHQEKIFVKTFGERLTYLGPVLNAVSDVHFAYFSQTRDCLGHADGALLPINSHPNAGIKIHISRREPFTRLADEGEFLNS